MTPDQIELARRSLELRADIDGKVLGQDIQALLDAARNQALEEAASIVYGLSSSDNEAHRIAAAIRGMIK